MNCLRCDRTGDSSLISPISHVLIALKWKVSEFHTGLTMIFQPRGCYFFHPTKTVKKRNPAHCYYFQVVLIRKHIPPYYQKISNTHRPCKSKRELNGVVEWTVRTVFRHLERVWSEHRGDCTAVCTRRLWRHVGLVMFKANPKKGSAFTLLNLGSFTAVCVACHSFFVEKLLQF